MNVIESSGLGKRYGSTWALRDCTLAIPDGHVAALVGPNGAGKTTLLNLTVGLAAQTAGTVAVLGGMPAGSAEALDAIAFVAQDTPVYPGLSVADARHGPAELLDDHRSRTSLDREVGGVQALLVSEVLQKLPFEAVGFGLISHELPS